MNPFVLALVLSSTFLHAGWNLLARRQRAEAQFFDRMLLAIAVIGLAPAAISEWQARSLSPRAWAYAMGSGVFCALYYLFLARGYASSDFTIVYPVARALPVLLVGLGDAMRGRYPTTLGWAGMALVVAGCFLVPLPSFREFAPERYLNRASLWMLLTALGTVGYTLLDKAAAEVVSPGPGTAARYGYVFYLVSWVAYAMLLRMRLPKSRETSEVSSDHAAGGAMAEENDLSPRSPSPVRRGGAGARSIGWRLPLWAGCLNFGAYWLVLWAYQLSERASYIVAFRQFSIVIGVVLAFIIYKEQGRAVRLTATLLIAAGLVVIGLWGH